MWFQQYAIKLYGFTRFYKVFTTFYICDISKMIIPFSACEASRSARSSWSCCSSFLGALKNAGDGGEEKGDPGPKECWKKVPLVEMIFDILMICAYFWDAFFIYT